MMNTCTHIQTVCAYYPVDDFEDSGGRGPSSGKGLDLGKSLSQKEAAIQDSKEDLKVRKGVDCRTACTHILY